MSGNYVAQVLKLAAHLPVGTMTRVEVLHDSWCALLNGTGDCDCDPELVVTPGRPPDHE